MRKSKLNHPVAVLRQIIGMGQKDFGALVDRDMETIKSIERTTNPLKLSEELAARISHETGVSLAWLLSGNPKAMPFVEGSFDEFTKATHDEWRADLQRAQKGTTDGTYILDNAPGIAIALLMLLARMGKSGKPASLAVYKAGKAIEGLYAEFWPEVAESGFQFVKALVWDGWDSRTHAKLSRAISAALKKHLIREHKSSFVKAQSKTTPKRRQR